MKKAIMGLAALAVLGGGGAGAYFILLKKPAEAAVPAADTHEEAKKEDDHGGGGDGHGAEAAGPKYVKIDPLVVPIVDSDGVSQVISMVVAFEVKGEENAKKVENLQPRIKDAFITSLYGILNNQTAMDKGVVKVGYVKKRLSAAAEKVLGPDVFSDVLLQTVQQNPI